MQPGLPAEGSLVWIRQHRWRVERARRENNAVRLDVAGRNGRLTFLAPFDRPCAATSSRAPRWVRPQALVARLAGLLGRTSSYRAVASMIDAKAEILAYQLEPVRAILGGARRVLIADAVGLGKTIQAGAVIAELQRREPGFRALVVAPSSLRAQWSDELRERFGIEARLGDAESLAALSKSAARDERVWRRPGVWIASIDYLKQPHVFGAACQRPWGLLVIDEAHGVCGETERHRAARELARRSSHVLLLSATPHNGDETAFDRLLELGALPADVEEPTVFRRSRLVLGQRHRRQVHWHSARLSRDETRLLNALVSFERAVLSASTGARNQTSLLLLSVFRKRALSTMGAFLVSIDRRLAWIESRGSAADRSWQPSLMFESDEDDVTQDEREALAAEIGLGPDLERSWLRRLREAGRLASRQESKVRYLARALRRTTEPVAVFTEFRDSLAVLRRHVEPVRSAALLHGGLTPQEQREQLDSFLHGSASVLLATDVASQGLNLQTRCRWVVNLELPWNPVRIEQRAGRVDRIGQNRPVKVWLLVSRAEAESGVLARLIRRTLSARQSLGADVLTLTTPGESSVRSHVLTGAPLAEPESPRRPVALCRRWSRAAAREAVRLTRQRRLARRWRAALQTSRCCLTSGDRLLPLDRLAGGNTLLCFSAPVVDGRGATLEKKIVLVLVPHDGRSAARDPDMLSELGRWIARRLQPRARRLQRLRRAEAARAERRERAIFSVLRRSCELRELQPGLFDRRSLRGGERAAHEISELQDELDARLRALEAESLVSVGVPVLACGIVSAANK